MTEDILTPVLRALDRVKADRRLTEVAKASGVPTTTVVRIAARATPNPGVLAVQALFDYFAANEPGLLRKTIAKGAGKPQKESFHE